MTLWTPPKPTISRYDQIMAYNLKKNLVGYWPLDEASGTRRDHSGLGNDLTDNATVTGNPGPSIWLPLASQFTVANLEYLSIADNASLRSPANVTWWGWAYWNGGNTRNMMSKFTTGGNQREWNLTFYTGTDRLLLEYSSDGIATTNMDAGGFVPSTSTWIFWCFWTDSAAATINFQVNNGAIGSNAFTGPLFAGTAPFVVGALNAGALWLFDGRVAGIGKRNSLTTPQERTWLYNRGDGRAYGQHLRLAA